MNREQLDLLKKAPASLDAARLLAERGFFDFATSRAYYSMSYMAEAFLLAEGLSFSKHSAVHAAFGRHFAHAGRVPAEMHRHLIDAGDKRKSADYEIGPKLRNTDAGEQVAHAEEFLQVAERLIGPVPPEDRENA